MTPRVSVYVRAYRAVQCSHPSWSLGGFAQKRQYANDPSGLPTLDKKSEEPSQQDRSKGSKSEPLPGVNEEKAATQKSMGAQPPEMEQGTEVHEVVKGDKDAQKDLPKVMRDEIKEREGGNKPPGSRSYSTYARAYRPSSGVRPYSSSSRLRQHLDDRSSNPTSWQSPLPQTPSVLKEDDEEVVMEEDEEEEQFDEEEEDEEMDEDEYEDEPENAEDDDDPHAPKRAAQGHKFPLPNMPLPPGSHLKRRYDSVVDQVTRLMMRHGKLGVAQKNMEIILSHLRTAPAPNQNSRHTLIPGLPPHSELPQNPTLYLTAAIDSIAPLFRLRNQRGAAGGGASLQIPVPMTRRQRRRQAVVWILNAVEKRKQSTSPFAKRFAEEVVAVVEGRSSIWEKRNQVHAAGIRARSNIGWKPRKR